MAIRIYCRHTSRYWMQEAEWQANKNQALDVHSTFPSFAFSVSPTVKAAALKRSYVCIQTKIKNIVSDIFSPKIDYRYISVKIICSKTTSESFMIKGVGAKSLCLLLSAYPMLLTGNLL